jgi:uncharacterized DUF497 family protein
LALRWIWDPDKAAANLRKHKVSFGLAELALADPLAVTYSDPWSDEERWRTLGRPSADLPTILLVVHTWPEADGENPDPAGRIISARKAEPRERRAYEEGQP